MYVHRTTSRITVGNSTSLQLAVWAPGGNALVLVNQNNVYYKPTAETQTNYQITTTGIYGSIYNAVPDWVYEGELIPFIYIIYTYISHGWHIVKITPLVV